jgi:hypothetical protein
MEIQRDSLEGLPLGEFQNMLVHKNATNMIGYGKPGACAASNTPTQLHMDAYRSASRA